jgi:hypothetical protein
MRRKVTNVISDKYRPKLSIRELEQEKPSKLMSHYGISEHGLQQELRKHCGDANQQQQKRVYEKVYGKKPE